MFHSHEWYKSSIRHSTPTDIKRLYSCKQPITRHKRNFVIAVLLRDVYKSTEVIMKFGLEDR